MNLRIPAAIALLTATACASTPDRAAPPSEHALTALLEAHDEAWNAHNPDAMTALYTPEASVVTPTGKRYEGTDALHECFAAPGPTKQTTSSTRLDAVQWLGPDVALIDATQTLSGPGVEVLGVGEAHLIGVVERRDGAWKFAAARPLPKLAR